MELTMTRLLLLTIVGAILPVSMVSASPWGVRANKRAELQDALDYLKKHLSDSGVDLAAGPRYRAPTGGLVQQEVAETKPIYDQRFNFGNQRETVDMEPVEMLINEQMASDDELSELESADLEDAISSDGELVDDLIADIIAKEILDDLENESSDNDETIEYGYTADENPTVSIDYDEEMENYHRFLAQRMQDQDETSIDNDDDSVSNEIDDDILNEVMMTFLTNNEDGQEQTRNNILTNELPEESDEEPLLTEAEAEELIVAENILREIDDELKREKMQQESLSKKKALKASPQAAPASCPILDYLVDDCEIAAVDGIGGDGYRQAFRIPCNWHQICYTCGYGYGISREICDEAFYLEMLSRCGTSEKCSERADFFLLAVAEDRVPLLQSPSVCQRPCVSDFLLGLDE